MTSRRLGNEDTAAEYARLQRAATQMLDAADTAARNNDPATEARAQESAGRLLDAASQIGRGW